MDDFITISRPKKGTTSADYASSLRSRIDAVAKFLGVSLDKFEFGTSLEVLGVTVDTDNLCFRVPPAKKSFIIAQLDWWANRRTCTKRELDSLIGYLQFLTRVIPWGRAFLGRCIRLSCSKSRPLHHINLNRGFQLDIAWWRHVLPSWDGVSFFFDDDWHEPDQFEVDASSRGYGCFYHPFYYSEPWSPFDLSEAQRDSRESMPYLELLAIARACATFCDKWTGKRILCRSDCLPASVALTKKYSPSPPMQRLIRVIGILALRHSFDIRVLHIESLKNIRADPLSRLDMFSFMCQVGPAFSKLSRVRPAELPSSPYENPSGSIFEEPLHNAQDKTMKAV